MSVVVVIVSTFILSKSAISVSALSPFSSISWVVEPSI
jgi:hypothetical protein